MKLIRERESLRKFTTIRVGGEAKYFATPKSVEEVVECIKFARDRHLPLLVLGGGSNTVLGSIEGLVVSTAFLRGIQVSRSDGYFVVEAMGGTPLKEIVAMAVKNNLEGIYKLLGFPATVGGAVSMNAGSFGVEISEFLEEVEFISWDLEVKRLKVWELDFGYRSSPFPAEGFICRAVFKLKAADTPVLEEYKRIRAKRKKTQPINMPTSGSTFKNPADSFAGALLEKVKMKGFRIGDVGFSTVHANFMVNYGEAKVEDVKRLIIEAKRRVYEEYGVKLEEEVKVIESSGSNGWQVL